MALILTCLTAGGGTAAAAGPDAAEAKTFRIGLVARDRAEPRIEGLSTIRSAFSRALGMEVEVFVARDYAALIEAQAGGRLDYAVYSAAAYAAASIRCGCVRALAAPVAANGAVGFRSVLIARPGGAQGAAEPPSRIAIGPADSLSTRLAPLASWPLARSAASEGRLVEAPSASAAEALFVAGSVDAFFGWVPAWSGDDAAAPMGGSLARLRVAGLDADDYRVIWQSGLLRHGPHAVRAEMPAERIERLARMLTDIDAEQPELRSYLERVHGGGFARVSHEDYAAALDAVGGLHGDAGSR